MLLAGTNNIRDVIAFPKTTSATSLMDEAPSFVSDDQLAELNIKIVTKIIHIQSYSKLFIHVLEFVKDRGNKLNSYCQFEAG